MVHEEALYRLPEAYGTALRLRGAGADERAIAAALGIPREAVGPLLALADAKLEQLLAAEAQPRRR
ncbi:MAG: hypothetical protein ACRDHD_00075 [Candidatus Limnocylindria bacterium]